MRIPVLLLCALVAAGCERELTAGIVDDVWIAAREFCDAEILTNGPVSGRTAVVLKSGTFVTIATSKLDPIRRECGKDDKQRWVPLR